MLFAMRSTNVLVYLFDYSCMNLLTCVYTLSLYIYTHTHTYIYIYMCVCVYIHMYVYMDV